MRVTGATRHEGSLRFSRPLGQRQRAEHAGLSDGCEPTLINRIDLQAQCTPLVALCFSTNSTNVERLSHGAAQCNDTVGRTASEVGRHGVPTGSADGPYCEWTDLLAVSRLERQELRRQRGLARALAWHDEVLELLKAELLPDARERAQQLPDLALRDPQQPVRASPGAAVGGASPVPVQMWQG